MLTSSPTLEAVDRQPGLRRLRGARTVDPYCEVQMWSADGGVGIRGRVRVGRAVAAQPSSVGLRKVSSMVGGGLCHRGLERRAEARRSQHVRPPAVEEPSAVRRAGDSGHSVVTAISSSRPPPLA